VLVRWLIILVAVACVLGVAERADAEHPIASGTQTMLWRDLEAGGHGQITYRSCSGTGPPIQAEWAAGIEAWDAALQFDFLEVACSNPYGADTRITWESGNDTCAPELYGCYPPPSCAPHGFHCDIVGPPYGNARILFDVVNYAPPFSGGANELPDSFEWRKYGALHEWSHNVGLAAHMEGEYNCYEIPSTPCYDCNVHPGVDPGVPTVTDGRIYRFGPTCPQSPGPRDIGSVICQIYGCHPNGAFVSTPTKVYVLQGGQKRWVPSSAVLDSWSDFSDVIPITDNEAKAYPDNPQQVGVRPGKLISSGGAVFLITNDGPDPYRRQKRRVLDNIRSQCFPGITPTPIAAGDANLHTSGPDITSCTPTHPSGSVVWVLNDAVYFINSNQPNQRRWVISQGSQNSWRFGPDLFQIPAAELILYTQVTPHIGFRPGRLIVKTSTQQVFLVSNEGDFGMATKRHVFDSTTFNCLFPGEPLIWVSDFEADSHPTGPPIQVPAGAQCQ
jgi:hypothetical protein